MIKKILAYSILGLLAYGCSSATKVESQFANSKVIIDGDQSEWQQNIKTVPKEGIGFGFQNDDEYLYLCLVTNNKQKMNKILHNGLTIWLEPENDGNYIGIKYPMQKDMREMMQERMNDKKQMPNQDGNFNENAEKMIQEGINTQNEYQIVNNDDYPMNTFPVNSQKNIQIKMGYKNYQFVYEVKIKLDDPNLTALTNIKPGDKIKVGFVTNQMDMPEMGGGRPEQGGGGMEPPSGGNEGGGGGFGGGMGGGGGRPPMGGGMGGNKSDMNTQLEYWYDVNLYVNK